jgi:hypothetical protein
LFAEIFPDGTIPAYVFSGLDDRERILLRADHSAAMQQKGLTLWGQCETARQMTFIGGGTERELAIALGLIKPEYDKDGKPIEMKKRVAAARAFVVVGSVPDNIYQHVLKYAAGEADGKPVTQRDTPFRWADLTGKISPAMSEDAKNGQFDLTDPKSKTQQVWSEILARVETETDSPNQAKALKPGDARALATTLAGSKEVGSKLAGKLLYAATKQEVAGVGMVDAVSVAKEIAEAERAQLMLSVFRIVMGPHDYTVTFKDAEAWIESHKDNLAEAIANHATAKPAAKQAKQKQRSK